MEIDDILPSMARVELRIVWGNEDDFEDWEDVVQLSADRIRYNDGLAERLDRHIVRTLAHLGKELEEIALMESVRVDMNEGEQYTWGCES